MQIHYINSSILTPLSAVYAYDTSYSITPQNFDYTTDGYYLNSLDLFSKVKDVKSNLDTLITLTDLLSTEKFSYLQLPEQNYEILLTYLNSPRTKFFLQAPFGTDLAFVSTLDDKCIFEIIFLDEMTCNIRQNYNSQLSYLTLQTGPNFPVSLNDSFFRLQTTLNKPYQTFYYLFDEKNSQISFFIVIGGVSYHIYDTSNILQPTLTPVHSNTFDSRSIFNIRLIQRTPTKVHIPSNWIVYNTSLNTSIIDTNRSQQNINNNFLVFTISNALSANNLFFNFLPLKNNTTNTGSNIPSNIYTLESSTLHRKYHTIHIDGDNLSVSYTTPSNELILNKDQLTYFRFPYICTPYIKLNINDTQLYSSGATPGDKPINSDKCFKKRQTDLNSTITDEPNGTWLCAWLSGNNNNAIWLDRYYNPNFYTEITALNATVNGSSVMVDDEVTFDIVNSNNIENIIFDLPSKLLFEPNCLYAYHHLGNNNFIQLINLNNNILQNLEVIYKTIDYNEILIPNIDIFNNPIYTFSENEVLIVPPVSSQTGSFTLSFYLNIDNFKSVFTDTIFSNNSIIVQNLSANNTNLINFTINAFTPYQLQYDITSLSNGWHNFIVTLDNEKGISNFYIDSFLVESLSIVAGENSFTHFFSNILTYGSVSSQGFNIKSFNVFNFAFKEFDVRNLTHAYANIQNIKWQVPSGQRTYLDTFERFFKFTLPGYKSGMFDVNIVNSNITDTVFQQTIENIIRTSLTNIPIHTKLNKIKWKNYA